MKNFKLFCMLMLIMFLFPSSSFAGAFGVYIDAGGGSGDTEYEFDYVYDEEESVEFDNDIGAVGIGFQMESNPMGRNDKSFSYRFQAGFESRNLALEYLGEDIDTDLKLHGLLINNTFAFGGNVSHKVRLWAGPQVLIGFYTGEADGFLSDAYDDDYDLDFGVLFGVGIAGGANFALGDDKAILTTTIGVRATGIGGFNNLDSDYEDEYEEDDDLITGSGGEFFASVGIMF